MIEVQGLGKQFTLHNQGGAVIPVLEGAAFSVAPGECVALTGESGAGKSTVMRILYGNYLAQAGSVMIGGIDLTRAEPLLALGAEEEVAFGRARTLLSRLRIPETLWSLSPTTFSGGEQQRVNIARGFAHAYPALLLDEPTASLDAQNRETVLTLIEEAKAGGAAIVGIFHDLEARNRVADREVDVSAFTPRAAA